MTSRPNAELVIESKIHFQYQMTCRPNAELVIESKIHFQYQWTSIPNTELVIESKIHFQYQWTTRSNTELVFESKIHFQYQWTTRSNTKLVIESKLSWLLFEHKVSIGFWLCHLLMKLDALITWNLHLFRFHRIVTVIWKCSMWNVLWSLSLYIVEIECQIAFD